MATIADEKKKKDEHDLGYKSLFAKKDRFLHFLKKYIGAAWADEIEEDDLVLMDKSFVFKDYKDRESDVIYRAKIKDREIIFYVLLEMQSSVDYTMSFRLLLYMTELLRREFENADKRERERTGYRLPAVIPVVLYNGARKWNAARRFKEYLNGHELFGENILDFEYILLDLNQSDEEFILSTNRLLDNIFELDRKNTAEDMTRVMNILIQRYRRMEQHEQIELLNWVKHILMGRITSEAQRNAIIEAIERGEETEVQYGWDRAFENERIKGKREGKLEGKREGKLEGERQKAIEIAKKMLLNGATVEDTSELTGLSEKEVTEVKSTLQK